MLSNTYYRGELILVQSSKYYPSIACGYKSAAVFNTCQEAEKWINKLRPFQTNLVYTVRKTIIFKTGKQFNDVINGKAK